MFDNSVRKRYHHPELRDKKTQFRDVSYLYQGLTVSQSGLGFSLGPSDFRAYALCMVPNS